MPFGGVADKNNGFDGSENPDIGIERIATIELVDGKLCVTVSGDKDKLLAGVSVMAKSVLERLLHDELLGAVTREEAIEGLLAVIKKFLEEN